MNQILRTYSKSPAQRIIPILAVTVCLVGLLVFLLNVDFFQVIALVAVWRFGGSYAYRQGWTGRQQ